MTEDGSRIRVSETTDKVLESVKNDLKTKEKFLKERKGVDADKSEFKWRNSGNRHMSNDRVLRIALKQLDVQAIDEFFD